MLAHFAQAVNAHGTQWSPTNADEESKGLFVFSRLRGRRRMHDDAQLEALAKTAPLGRGSDWQLKV
ncbi:MAG: hypothetical protein ABSH49_03280 [Bryobacteraceae bacterium]